MLTDDDCSCSSCECSICTDQDNNDDNMQIISSEPTNISDFLNVICKKQYSGSVNLHSSNWFDKCDRFSINNNRPSINALKESSTVNIPSEMKNILTVPTGLASTNEQGTSKQQLEDRQSIKNDEQRSTVVDLEYIYKMIDQSYTKLPVFYNSIKQTKLDTDFVLSVNDYLDRLKANIYKDLIRRETLLRNGKNHARNLISLIRCICKISYEQALELPDHSILFKRAVLYAMTAIDYILQGNFPQKKPLFNYILNEFIFMWLHENLRVIQEDFSIIIENGTKDCFFQLCICLFNKLESICAINWERLQMIQNYRLTHFNQLMKTTSIKLEKNKEFISQFGISLKSDILITPLYSNRTENELTNINEIHDRFRTSIAKILLEQSQNSINNRIEEDHRPSIDITSIPLINKSKSNEVFQSSMSAEDQPIRQTTNQQKPIWNIVSETRTQSIEPVLLPIEDDVSFAVKTNTSNPLIKPINSHSALVSTGSSLLSNASTSVTIGNSEDQNDLQQTQEEINDIIQKSNSPKEGLLSSDHSLRESSTLAYASLTKDLLSPSLHPALPDRSIPIDSKTILDTEVNELINFLTKLAYSPTFTHPKSNTLLKKLEFCLEQTGTDPNSLIEQVRNTHPKSSLSVKDPLFLAAFTRALRKELEDGQILNKIDRGHLNEDLQNIGHLPFETINVLKLPKMNASLTNQDNAAGDNIDQNRVFIEVIHDPSRCTPNSEFSYDHKWPKSTSNKSIDTTSSSIESPNHHSSNHSQQRWYWMSANQSSLCNITADSLFCARKSLDKNTYSITVEHNELFR